MSENFWDTTLDLTAMAACIEHGLLLPGIGHECLLVLLDDLSSNMRSNSNCKRNRNGNRIRNRGFGLEEMSYFNNNDFKKMFRLSRVAFYMLVDIIAPEFVEETERYAEYSSGSSISIVTRLAVSLRWLAGGSYIDICFEFEVKQLVLYLIKIK
jgi:hypothetical protein